MAGNPTVDNLHPLFLQQLLAFIAASGGKVQLGSGWRSYEEQAQLYADWLAGKPGQARAAPPGKSNHNHGLAMDLKYGPGGEEWAHAHAAEFGLRFPMEDEPWHIEPMALDGMKSGTGGAVDLSYQPVSPEAARDRAKALYGYLGWYVDHPEIGPILIEAAMNGWDPARLQGALTKTQWWQTTSESARQWDALVVSDNATAARRIKETALAFGLEAAQLGIPLDNNRIYAMSVEALRHGWNDDEMRLALAAEMRYRPGQQPVGGVSHIMGEVGKVAADYMIPVNEAQRWEWARRIVGGASDMEAVKSQLQALAAARFPHLAGEFAKGTTPGQFFAPYRNAIAQALEMSPDEVDLMSERWAPVASFTDPRTGKTRPMTFAEAQRYARAQPGWNTTDNAWDTAAPVIDTIIKTFGEAA